MVLLIDNEAAIAPNALLPPTEVVHRHRQQLGISETHNLDSRILLKHPIGRREVGTGYDAPGEGPDSGRGKPSNAADKDSRGESGHSIRQAESGGATGNSGPSPNCTTGPGNGNSLAAIQNGNYFTMANAEKPTGK